jgi:hypothetical protein
MEEGDIGEETNEVIEHEGDQCCQNANYGGQRRNQDHAESSFGAQAGSIETYSVRRRIYGLSAGLH